MDRRQQKTRTAIFNAFETLLTQKNYNKITVREIIDTADVGRTTFYDHFETKDELLRELCEHLFRHVFSNHSGIENPHNVPLTEGDPKGIITHILCHLKDNGHSIARLIAGESSEIFLTYFKKYTDDLLMKTLLNKMTPKLQIPESFLKNHISGSFVNMIQWWIRNGMKESPEKLAEYFLAVIEPIL